MRDLGILFKSNLCFETHIDSIIAKAKQRLYLIKKSFTSSDCYALVLAFKSYVIPLLEYCSPVWSPSQLGSILRIESVQRLFTKYLSICSDCSSYSERLLVCDLVSLERRRLIADLVLFYKIVHKMVFIDLDETLIPLSASITRGHSRRFRVPIARTNLRNVFFTNRTIRVWNNLTEVIVSADSIKTFKTLLSNVDLSNYLVFN